jgi:hypothetical protein
MKHVAAPYAFRMRAYAAAHFAFDDVMTVTWNDAEAKLQSEYTGGNDGRAYAVTIHGEIRGLADTVEDAEARFSKMIGNCLPMIAVAANAAIADPLAVVTHGLDITEPQPFIGYRTPSASEWFPPGKRLIDAAATHEFVAAVGNHPQGELLLRAIESYRRALANWIPERRLVAGEYLFISAETLGRFMVEARAAARSMTPKNLVQLQKAGTEASLRRRYLVTDVFGGDDAAYDAMKKASDGFEHGYMAVDQVRGLLDPVLEHSMSCVRAGLILESGVAADARERLLVSGYDEPRGLVPFITFLRGHVRRQDPNAPPPAMDGAAIELEWSSPVFKATRTDTGEVELSLTQEAKPTKLPPNTTLDLFEAAWRAADMKLSDDKPLDVKVKREGEDQWTDVPPASEDDASESDEQR